MRMNYFGDFLLKKKIITEQQLIESLCEQIRSTPPVVEVLYKLEILTPSEISNVVKTQIRTDKSIFQILKGDFNLSSDSINKIKSFQISERKPLGQILIERNIIDQSNLQSELGEFLESKTTDEVIVELPSVDAEQPEVSEAAMESLRELGITSLDGVPNNDEVEVSNKNEEVEISQAALDSLEELGISPDQVYSDEVEVENDPFLEEFLEQITEAKISMLMKILTMTYDSYKQETDFRNILNSFYREIHIIRGAVRLGDLKLTEKYLASTEGLVETIIANSNDHVNGLFDQIYPVLKNWVEVLWELREALKEKSEVDLMANQEFKTKFMSVLKDVGTQATKIRSNN